MTLLNVNALTKRYGDTPVFADVDLQVAAGEFVAVLGESGVGKSTLLNCIAGLDTVDAGEVRINGTVITTLADCFDHSVDLTMLDEVKLLIMRRSSPLLCCSQPARRG